MTISQKQKTDKPLSAVRFRFIRDHNKPGVEPVDVVLVQLQKPPYAAAEDPNVD